VVHVQPEKAIEADGSHVARDPHTGLPVEPVGALVVHGLQAQAFHSLNLHSAQVVSKCRRQPAVSQALVRETKTGSTRLAADAYRKMKKAVVHATSRDEVAKNLSMRISTSEMRKKA